MEQSLRVILTKRNNGAFQTFLLRGGGGETPPQMPSLLLSSKLLQVGPWHESLLSSLFRSPPAVRTFFDNGDDVACLDIQFITILEGEQSKGIEAGCVIVLPWLTAFLPACLPPYLLSVDAGPRNWDSGKDIQAVKSCCLQTSSMVWILARTDRAAGTSLHLCQYMP